MTGPERKRLPDTRPSRTRKGSYLTHEFYVTIGFYDGPDDYMRPGEVFVKIAKHGSDLARFADGWAQMVSIALQYGIPWDVLRVKWLNCPQPDLYEAIVLAVDQEIRERCEIVGLEQEATHAPSD